MKEIHLNERNPFLKAFVFTDSATIRVVLCNGNVSVFRFSGARGGKTQYSVYSGR